MFLRRALLLTSTLAALVALPAQARWESVEEPSAANVDQSFLVVVEKDGTEARTVRRTVEIRRDDARQTFGTISFSYNAATSKLVKVSAETIVGGKTMKVGKEHIEDKPVKTDDLGFDRINRVTIAFPRVEIGARVRYEYTLKTHTVAVPGFFSDDMAIGADGIPDFAPAVATWRSRLPLSLVVTDPDEYLEVKERVQSGWHEVTVTLNRPAHFRVVSEKYGNWFAKSPNPTIVMSTTKDWNGLGRTLGTQWEKAFLPKLPALFAPALEKARAAEGFQARAETFIAGLIDTVRYMGDWRTVRGSFVARPMEEIARTGFGDCKDLSLITAKALRQLGYKADPAVVWRGEQPPRESALPTLSAFNHAIVRAEDETGKVFWLDPTNNTAFVRPRPDIAGRSAMVLDTKSPRLEKIPELTPSDGTWQLSSRYTFQPMDETAVSKHKLSFLGHAAELITGAELSMPRSQIDELLTRSGADDNEVISSEIAPYELKSRVIRDLSFEMATRSRWTLARTTAGYGYEVPGGYEELAKLDLKDRVSGYYLGAPATRLREVVIESARLIGEAPGLCRFDSRWIEGERVIEAKDGGIVAWRRVATKTYGISAEELATEEFRQLQHRLRECFGAYSVVFAPNATTAPTSSKISH